MSCIVLKASVEVCSSHAVCAAWTAVLKEEEETNKLCACLTLAAPLAAAAAGLQARISQAQLAPVDRISYPALSAVVTACQIQTARAVNGGLCDNTRSSLALHCFWSPDANVISG